MSLTSLSEPPNVVLCQINLTFQVHHTIKHETYNLEQQKSLLLTECISFFCFFHTLPLTPKGEPNPQCEKMNFTSFNLHQSSSIISKAVT